MTCPAWGELSEHLATIFADFGDGARLILRATRPTGAYVQAGQEDSDLVIEAVADHNLPAESRIGRDGVARLRAIGWSEPEFELGNWTHHVTWPATTAEYQRTTDMMIRALRDVYGVRDPADLRYAAWNDRRSPAGLELPLLGVAISDD